jgi:multidrug transporter EmrE-like cation transporter
MPLSSKKTGTTPNGIRLWYFFVGLSQILTGIFSLESRFFGASLTPVVRPSLIIAGSLNLFISICLYHRRVRRFVTFLSITVMSCLSFILLVLGTDKLNRGTEWAGGSIYLTLSYGCLFVYFVSVVVIDHSFSLELEPEGV